MYGSFEGRSSSTSDPPNDNSTDAAMTSIKLVPINLARPPSDEDEDEVDGNEEDSNSDSPMMRGRNIVHPAEHPEIESPKEKKGILDKIDDFIGELVDDHHVNKKNADGEDDTSIISDELMSGYSLHQAAAEGSVSYVKQVLHSLEQQGKIIAEEMNRTNMQGFAPLHLASRHNHKAVIEFLLDNGAAIDQYGSDDLYAPIHLAAKYDMVLAAKTLLHRGANPKLQNFYGSTALHFAARRGNLELCQNLLGYKGVNPNITDNSGVTPLHSAMLGGKASVVRFLIDNNADVEAEDKEGERPIHFAAAEDQADLIDLLAKGVLRGVPEDRHAEVKRSFVNAYSSESDTALHVASQAGYEDTVKTLVSLGADVNVRTDTKATPLHLAAIGGQLPVVRYLVMHGAKVNATDSQQDTPLHRACQYGRLETVKYLHQNGARIDAKDNENFTPLLIAVWKGQDEVVKFLLDSGARIKVTDINMKNALHLAIEEDWDETLALLIERSGDALINAADKDYRTPLHYAATMGNDEAIEMLLKKSAQVDCGDNEEKTPIHIAAECGKLLSVKLFGEAAPGIVNSTDDHGRSPLHLAAINGHKRVCNSLIEMGAETSCRDDVNWTPLDYAAQQGHTKTVQLLLDNDAPVDAMDKNHGTPLHHASENGHVDCIKILLDYGASISGQNKAGRNCLELAVENFHRDACMAFIKHKRWRETLKHANNDGVHPMEKLVEYAPEVAEIVLTRCIEHSKEGVKHRDHTIMYDFSYLDLHPDDQQGRTFFAPENMVVHKRDNLLSHPLIVKLIDVKFARLARWIYFGNVALYLLFVSLLTALLIIDKERVSVDATKTEKTTFQTVVPWFTLLLAVIQICKEIVQFYYLRRHYFKDPVNYIEIFLYTTTILFMMPFILENLDSTFDTSTIASLSTADLDYLNYLEDIKWNAGALAILIAWANLLLYLKRFPTFGLYVVMFIEVFKTVISVLAVFSIFIVAFALSFFVLLDRTDAFKHVGRAIVKTSVMTIGEFEYSDILSDTNGTEKMPYEAVTFLIFVLFLVMMPILIMNLLVGLAIGDIEAVRKTAYLRILKAQVRILYTLECTYPRWLLKATYVPQVYHKPNEKKWYRRLLGWLLTSDYDTIKEEQRESTGKEEIILRELTFNREELDKQKKRMKTLTDLLEEQFEVTKRISQKLGLEDDD